MAHLTNGRSGAAQAVCKNSCTERQLHTEMGHVEWEALAALLERLHEFKIWWPLAECTRTI